MNKIFSTVLMVVSVFAVGCAASSETDPVVQCEAGVQACESVMTFKADAGCFRVEAFEDTTVWPENENGACEGVRNGGETLVPAGTSKDFPAEDLNGHWFMEISVRGEACVTIVSAAECVL